MPSRSNTTVITDDAIRDRAYFLWEADGRPDGRGDHYWGLALTELTAAAIAPAVPDAAKPKKPPASPKASGKAAKKAEAVKPAKATKKAEAGKPTKKATTKPRAAAVTPKKAR
ncbi:DUF2934 domain-containing protein [Devosia sp.]|uniref:DUF2934 domain-containing protein n=1 Tax=Devosia sp. TaxID=1871048 RepID=UPI003BAA5E60